MMGSRWRNLLLPIVIGMLALASLLWWGLNPSEDSELEPDRNVPGQLSKLSDLLNERNTASAGTSPDPTPTTRPLCERDLFRRAHPDAVHLETVWITGVKGYTMVRQTLWHTDSQGLVITEEEWRQSADPETDNFLSQKAYRADSLLLQETGNGVAMFHHLLQKAGYNGRFLNSANSLLQVWLPDFNSILEFDQAESHLAALASGDWRVHRNFLFFPMSASPDPLFAEQWSLERVDVATAWQHTVGNQDAIVAVIDSGLDRDHPDFLHAGGDNLWIHPGEIENGLDDDGNGFVDDLWRWNFVDDTNDSRDFLGHGTQMAGIIAAAGDNRFGISGVNHRASLLPLKVGDASFSTDAVVIAVDYATDLRQAGYPLAVLSNSYGRKEVGKDPSERDPLYDAIARAAEAGILFVAAAGNGGTNNDGLDFLGRSQHYFPSDYVLDNILSVTATDRNDQRLANANHGAVSVDLAAPGLDIISTTLNGEFRRESGTSHAAALVAGSAALLWAKNPGLSVADLREILMDRGDPIESLAATTVSGKRLNIAQSMAAVLDYPKVLWAMEDKPAAQIGWPLLLVGRVVEGAGAIATVEFKGSCGSYAEASRDGESNLWFGEVLPPGAHSGIWKGIVVDVDGRSVASPELRLQLLEPHQYWSIQAIGREIGREELTAETGPSGALLVREYFHGWQSGEEASMGAVFEFCGSGVFAWELIANRRATDLYWRLEFSENLLDWSPLDLADPQILWEETDRWHLRYEFPASETNMFVRERLDWID